MSSLHCTEEVKVIIRLEEKEELNGFSYSNSSTSFAPALDCQMSKGWMMMSRGGHTALSYPRPAFTRQYKM